MNTPNILNAPSLQADYHQHLKKEINFLEMLMIVEFSNYLHKNNFGTLLLSFNEYQANLTVNDFSGVNKPIIKMVEIELFEKILANSFENHLQVLFSYSDILEKDTSFFTNNPYQHQKFTFNQSFNWIEPLSFALQIENQKPYIESYTLQNSLPNNFKNGIPKRKI